MKYIVIAFDGKDLSNLDGAPFNLRHHISDLSDDQIKEIFGDENNRVLILGKQVFDRVTKLVHFPIRKAKFGDLFGLNALTLSSGCKVKCQDDWNKIYCQSIFRESWIKAICPDRPVVEKIYEDYSGEAVESLRKLINLPKDLDFGFDYETSGLPKKDVESENFRYVELQGRIPTFHCYSGKTFQITGVSICSDDRHSYYYDFLSIINSPHAQEFFNDFKEFLDVHSETCWVYNSNFETTVSYIFTHKFYVFQDAAAVNYIEGRNMYRQSLKVTVQRLVRIKSWDDAFDDLIDGLNYLLSDAFQVDWNMGTVVQDGVTYVWYQAPYFADLFRSYGEDMIKPAMDLAAKSFMNPFLCIPAKILGSYCNVDSYSTLELARYMRNRYSKACIDVFTANLRFHVYLNSTGNFIDSQEYKRQKDVANKASNWGMLLTWQQLTKLEIEQCNVSEEESASKGSEILSWCVRNRVNYNPNGAAMMQVILSKCMDWNRDYQLNEEKLHDALPWDYTYDNIYNQIVAWGGLGNIFSKKNAKFWNSNAWVAKEYGEFEPERLEKLKSEIYVLSLKRRQEWLWYLCKKIPNWDSDVPEYVTFDGVNSIWVDEFKSTDGLPWYESPEFDVYAHQMGMPFTQDHPHYFISGCLNVGAPAGMEYFKNQMTNNTDGWMSALVTLWMQYDSYVFGQEFEEKYWNTDWDRYDIWNTIKDWKFVPQRIFIDDKGKLLEAMPIFDDRYTEIFVETEIPGTGIKVPKAVNSRKMPDEDAKISLHPEYMNVEMIECDWEEAIGYRYLYVDHFISKEHFIVFFNTWWKREVRGYKDFMECLFGSYGLYEMATLKKPWDWKAIGTTKLNATNTKLDEIRPIIGLFTWRKFRKILGTYLKNLLIEGANYTKPEYTVSDGGLVISEYTKPEWEEGWDICRGHPNWNCMGVHTKRWSSGFHTLFGDSDTKKIITVPKDKLFFYLDISQAEPRTLAYKSGDPLMKGWYEAGKDIYIELAKQFNPEVVNATWMTDEQKKERLKELRGLYKVLVLAIMYGMGIGALAGMTGKPMDVAKKYKRDFLDAMPLLEKFIQERMDYPSEDNPSVYTILGDYLELYPYDNYRWKRQGINFCIQSFSALVLVCGFENMVRTAMHDGLTFSPIGTVHDSSQMIMDAKFIYNCQAHFDLNYTEYLYQTHGVKYKGDIKIGVNYYDLSKMHIVDDHTIQLDGSADSINKILEHLRTAGVTDMKLNVDEASIVPDYYSSVPKQVVRTGGGGAMPDKSKYSVQITFGDDVINYHRSLVEGEISKSEVQHEMDNLSMSSSEFNDVDNEETETDE